MRKRNRDISPALKDDGRLIRAAQPSMKIGASTVLLTTCVPNQKRVSYARKLVTA